MRKALWMSLSMITLCICVSCASTKTFVKGEGRWLSVELRQDLNYDRAWTLVTERLIKQFDLEMLQKEDGYFRTSWLYNWTGQMDQRYRVRVTGKFSSDHKKLELKCEAEYGGSGYWESGYDTRLLQTLQTDIMGTVGNTTR